MSSKNDGGPAFPISSSAVGNPNYLGCNGMTLRDWFAGQVLAGLTQEIYWSDAPGAQKRAQEIADTCYMVADAMLAAREDKAHE